MLFGLKSHSSFKGLSGMGMQSKEQGKANLPWMFGGRGDALVTQLVALDLLQLLSPSVLVHPTTGKPSTGQPRSQALALKRCVFPWIPGGDAHCLAQHWAARGSPWEAAPSIVLAKLFLGFRLYLRLSQLPNSIHLQSFESLRMPQLQAEEGREVWAHALQVPTGEKRSVYARQQFIA